MHVSVRFLGLSACACAAAACADSRSATEPTAPQVPALAASAVQATAWHAGSRVAGAVYASTNAASGNAVVAYARDKNGLLSRIGSFNTGGTGIGGTVDPLGSQFSVILSSDDHHLYVVDAGSHDIAVFDVKRDGSLTWRQTIDCRGALPVSLALHHHRLYVLNASDSSVGVFHVHDDGTLSDLQHGGWHRLPAGVGGPSTIGVVGDGRAVVVTEKTANRLDVFPLDANGGLMAPTTIASNGGTPFGFDVDHHGVIVVSEAGPNALSSYDLTHGTLDLVDGSVANDQKATCWVRLTPDGRSAYSVNSATASLSLYSVGSGGALSLVTPGGATGVLPSGTGPLDLDVTPDSRFVYTIGAGSGAIGAFSIGTDGALTLLPGATGAVAASAGAEGLAAF